MNGTNPDLLNKMTPRVSDAMNHSLLQPYSAEEVKKALFSIGDMKALGTNGLPVIFFKECWHLLGDSLTREVLDAMNNKQIPED